MKTLFAALTLFAVLGTLAPTDAASAPVTFVFQGVVFQVDDLGPTLDGSVSAGTPFAGSYTFDPTTPNESLDPSFALYEAIEIGIDIGNYEFRSVAVARDIWIFVGNAPDRYIVNSFENEAVGFFAPPPGQNYDQFLRIQWMLTGGDPLGDNTLPSSPPDLSRWLGNTLEVAAELSPISDPVFAIRGRVTSVVPEPGSLGQLGASLLLIEGIRYMMWRTKRER